MEYVSFLPLVIWVYLIFFRGNFWTCESRVSKIKEIDSSPSVLVLIPARNEKETIGAAVLSLLKQNYLGKIKIIIIDDNSSDGTSSQIISGESIQVLRGKSLPAGWTGKLWALHQGLKAGEVFFPDAEFILFTDADIKHNSSNINELMSKCVRNNLDLASLMVRLKVESFWEYLLIPAFVYFFQMLYPFAWVNDARSNIAAAAGGCMLIKKSALNLIGGLSEVKNCLIDDCAIGKALKVRGSIWIGLSEETVCLRSYRELSEIWRMVSRTAYTQLNLSVLNLLNTILGMFITYLVPVLCLIFGLIIDNKVIFFLGLSAYVLMLLSYFPIIKFYKIQFFWIFSIPLAGMLFGLMTLSSAIKHWSGKGGNWKGRDYP